MEKFYCHFERRGKWALLISWWDLSLATKKQQCFSSFDDATCKDTCEDTEVFRSSWSCLLYDLYWWWGVHLIISIGERYIAVWRIDGSEKQSASCVLGYFWMEHPAVFLDSRCIDNGNIDKSGLYVLAISEIGVCYFGMQRIWRTYVIQKPNKSHSSRLWKWENCRYLMSKVVNWLGEFQKKSLS